MGVANVDAPLRHGAGRNLREIEVARRIAGMGVR
jgi:hypothetical protein